MPRKRARAARRRRARPFAVRGRARARPRSFESGGSEGMSEAILFDRDQVERLERPRRPPEAAARIGAALGRCRPRLRGGRDAGSPRRSGSTTETRACLATSKDRAIFRDHGRYIHVTTYAPDEDDEGRVDLARVRRGRALGRHRSRQADPRARGVRRARLGLRRHGLAGRPGLPGGAAGMGARVVLGRVRADGAAAGGVRHRRDARRGEAEQATSSS